MALAAVAVLWPRAVSMPLAVMMGWLGVAMLISAIRLRYRRQQPRRKRVRTPVRVKTDPP